MGRVFGAGPANGASREPSRPPSQGASRRPARRVALCFPSAATADGCRAVERCFALSLAPRRWLCYDRQEDRDSGLVLLLGGERPMTTGSPSYKSLLEVPGRLFLDSSTLQTLQDYGEFIYDGAEIPQDDRIWSIPDGFENVDALQQIMFVGKRMAFEFVISAHSLCEVVDRGSHGYVQWAFEILDYWQRCLATYDQQSPPFSRHGAALAGKMTKRRFGYLSRKDAELIRDALILECEAFLTMDKKLIKNAPHIDRALGLKVLAPLDYWKLLRPWAPLFV